MPHASNNKHNATLSVRIGVVVSLSSKASQGQPRPAKASQGQPRPAKAGKGKACVQAQTICPDLPLLSNSKCALLIVTPGKKSPSPLCVRIA